MTGDYIFKNVDNGKYVGIYGSYTGCKLAEERKDATLVSERMIEGLGFKDNPIKFVERIYGHKELGELTYEREK